MRLNLPCLIELEKEFNELAAAATTQGEHFRETQQAVMGDVEEKVREVADDIGARQDQLDDQLSELAEETIPELFGELLSNLTDSAMQATNTSEGAIERSIAQAGEQLERTGEEIKDVVEETSRNFIGSGASVLGQFRDDAERRIAQHCETRAKEFCEEALRDLAARTTLDLTASQASIALSGSISAALPYLIAAKAALGSIKRAKELLG
jgi:hypothetical protein